MDILANGLDPNKKPHNAALLEIYFFLITTCDHTKYRVDCAILIRYKMA